MKCQTCNSSRIAFAIADLKGTRYSRVKDTDIDDIPQSLGITDDSNYLRMHWCLSCGQIQGQWPAKRSVLEPPSIPPLTKKVR